MLLRTGGHDENHDPARLWASRCMLPSAPGSSGRRSDTRQAKVGGGAGVNVDGTVGGQGKRSSSSSSSSSRTGSNTLTTFSCKSGTGAFEYKEPSLATPDPAPASLNLSSPFMNSNLNCNWSIPEMTNIPDAPSRTCGGHLPKGGGIGVIGRGFSPPPLLFSSLIFRYFYLGGGLYYIYIEKEELGRMDIGIALVVSGD